MGSGHILRSCLPCNVRPLHAMFLMSGVAADAIFAAKLVSLYSRIGDTRSASLVFQKTPAKSTFLWNTIISCYVHNRLFLDAVSCFFGLVTSGARPDWFTFPNAVKACSTANAGRKMHGWVLKLGFGSDLYVSSSIIHMYSKLGLVSTAHDVFREMPVRDLGSWNAMVSGLCQNGNAAEALFVFKSMLKEGIGVGAVTLSSIFPASAQLGELLLGLSMHAFAIKEGLHSEVYVCNALIDVYAKLSCAEDARHIFDEIVDKDLVSWNSVLAAFEQAGDPNTTFHLFEMMKKGGLLPDAVTLVSLASGAAQFGDTSTGCAIHGYVLRRGWDVVHVGISNAIVDMYGKLSMLEYARYTFDRMSTRDLISWNTMIGCYSQNGLATEAIDVFNEMEKVKLMVPAQGTLVAVLPAFSHLGSLRQGMRIHGMATKVGLAEDLYVGTCFVDMYAKCGRLNDSQILFKQLPAKNLISWNAIIAGHGLHGHADMALDLFKDMQEEGVKPDQVTFLALLSACSHAGLIDHGKKCFSLMHSDYQIEPSTKHYACMVDLFGRSGELTAAYDFIKSMPIKPDSGVWGALLSACRVYGNVELGTYASSKLFEIDSKNTGFYVLLSNMYARFGKWNRVNQLRSSLQHFGLRKTPGWSSIELKSKVHVFYTSDKSHPQGTEVYKELEILMNKVKSLGYVPDYSCVLQDVDEDEKERILFSHSEKLAITYGIISTLPETTIHVFKNLRVCMDCHNATKFISKITDRDIIVRDSNRFHHFKEGTCSCGDYW